MTDKRDGIEAIAFPNRLVAEELETGIVRHMAENMEFRLSEVIRLVTANIPNNATATYHLLLRKLRRYLTEERLLGRTQDKLAAASKQVLSSC